MPITNDDGIKAIADEIVSMCSTLDDMEWLKNQFLRGAIYFPRPIEVRRVYCKKKRPADGVEPEQLDLEDTIRGEV